MISDELFDKINNAADKIIEIDNVNFETARSKYLTKRWELEMDDEITRDDKEELEELEQQCREEHKRFCEKLTSVFEIINEAMEILDKSKSHPGNAEQKVILQEILDSLPECPSESKLFEIPTISDDDDIDDICVTSDEESEHMTALETDEESLPPLPATPKNPLTPLSPMASLSNLSPHMPAHDDHIDSSFLMSQVIDKAKAMKNIENELKECEELKNRSKTEMFDRRDQQLDVTQYQDDQRNLFNRMNELKIEYRRAKADLRTKIFEVLPYVDDAQKKMKLTELLEKIETEDALESARGNKSNLKFRARQLRIFLLLQVKIQQERQESRNHQGYHRR